MWFQRGTCRNNEVKRSTPVVMNPLWSYAEADLARLLPLRHEDPKKLPEHSDEPSDSEN